MDNFKKKLSALQINSLNYNSPNCNILLDHCQILIWVLTCSCVKQFKSQYCHMTSNWDWTVSLFYVQQKKFKSAPFYIKNNNIISDLNVFTIWDEVNKANPSYLAKVFSHPNRLAKNLLLFEGHKRLIRLQTMKLT